MMKKNLALAGLMMMLVATSGEAFANTAAPNARYSSEATGLSDQQAVNTFNAFDPEMATQTVEPNAHPYHGGPKYND